MNTKLISVIGVAVMASLPPVAGAVGEALEEITVTARKVTESAQTVPVAVTAFSAEMLQTQVVVDLTDLRGAPGVYLQRGGPFRAASTFGIRGISVADKESTFDPAVGVVLDGVYIGRTLGSVLDLYDVENVEVLRGPQGSLFGRNTIGGVLNITSRSPAESAGLRARVQYSRFDTAEITLAGDLPVSDTVRTHAAINAFRSDGYYRNTAPGGPSNVGGAKALSARLAVEYRPDDTLRLAILYNGVRDRSPSSAEQNVTRDPSIAPLRLVLTLPFYDSAFTDVTPDPYATSIDLDPAFGLQSRQDLDQDGFTLQVEKTTGRHTVTSITGYYDWLTKTDNDFDRTPEVLLNAIEVNDHRQVTQEFRIRSDYGGRFEWIGGLFYFDSAARNQSTQIVDQCLFVVPNVPGGAFCPIPATFRVARATGYFTQTAQSYAAFGELYWSVTERLRATLGGRYTHETKEFVSDPANDNFIPGNPAPAATARSKEDWSDFSPKFGFDYRWSEDVMAYASYTRGFRGGGYNGRAGSLTSIGPYDPEDVTAWEVGLKSEFLDRRLRLNAAAYRSDYKDMQLSIFRPVPGGGQETVVQNAGEATISGLEVEATARATDRLTLTASLSLMDAKYDRFCAAIPRLGATSRPLCGPNGAIDNTDLDLPRTPKTETFLGIDYLLPLGSRGDLQFAADVTHRAQLETTASNYPIGRTEAVDLVNATIAWQPDERWRVAAFGKNLLDEQYVYFGTIAGNLFAFASSAAPRTYGLSVEFRY